MATRDAEAGTRQHAVFLHDFVDVGRPFASIEPTFCSDGAWLAPLAERAAADGETLFLRLGGDVGARWLRIEIRIRLGSCTAHGDARTIPIRWEAARLARLFPVLDANLELHRIGPGTCRLALQGSYRPPLEAVGQALDRALLHRVAESTVRSFLHQLAGALEVAGATDAVDPEIPATSGGL